MSDLVLSQADFQELQAAAEKGPVLGTSEQDQRIRAALDAVVNPVTPTPTVDSWGGYSAQHPMPAGAVYGSSSSPWNSRITNPVLMPNSAEMVKWLLARGSPMPGNITDRGGYGHPIYYAKESDPIIELKGSGAMNGHRIHCPVEAVPAPGTDKHMCIIQPNGDEPDLWQASRGSGIITYNGGSITRVDGSLVGGLATASHTNLTAGIIRAPELQAGKIEHALFGVVNPNKAGAFKWPAAGTDGRSSEALAPLQGQRFYLAYSDAEIAALKLPAWKAAIITALAHYGFYVCDSGGPGLGFMFESWVMYTAFGLPNPFTAIAKAAALPTWEGEYVFNLSNGVDWTRFRAIA